jgi:GNAT superfamily N-acetyltransferase
MEMPGHLAGFSARPLRLEDFTAIRKQVREIRDADADLTATADQIAKIIANPAVNIATDTLLVVSPEGLPVAGIFVVLTPEAHDERVLMIPGSVHPAFRRRGIGTFLLTWAEERCRQVFQGLRFTCPGYMRLDSRQDLDDRIALYERRGFHPVRRFCQMMRDVSAPHAPITVPESVSLEKWDDEKNAAIMAASDEIFADDWASQPVSTESWNVQVKENPNFRGDLSVIAFNKSNEQVIGLCLCSVETGHSETTSDGWVFQLGIRPEWRGKRIASALLLSAVDNFKAAGLTTVRISLDVANPTGAAWLAAKDGFVPVARYVRFSKPITTNANVDAATS